MEDSPPFDEGDDPAIPQGNGDGSLKNHLEQGQPGWEQMSPLVTW